jgi:lipoprotein-anchoring transpeptidase ErfK/SrfK
MTYSSRILALLALTVLTACGAKPEPQEAPVITPGYEEVVDEGFVIEAVEARHLAGGHDRKEVDYAGTEKAGTIVVDTHSRRLYLVLEEGRAMSYSIAVGREGLAFAGSGYIGRKEKWPSWQPTANMIKTRPDLYLQYAAGTPGGLDNPLGARAMYLYRNGRDSKFRIHGTIDNATIGRATSAGCIRLFNQDAIHLFEQIKTGAKVKVRSLQESIDADGPFMDNAWGVAVPETPQNIAQKEIDLIAKAEQEAADAAAAAELATQQAIEAEKAAVLAEKAAAKAERKRLAACRRQSIAEADCPALPEVTVAAEAPKVNG